MMRAALLLPLVLLLQTPTPQQRVQDRLRELEQESARLTREARTLVNELRRLSLDREMRAAELEARTLALQDAEAALTALEQEQSALAAAIERERPLVRARVVELYKRGRASDLRRIVDAASARDAMRAWRQMAAASSRDAARFAQHRASIARLDTARKELGVQRGEAERLRAEAGLARAALDRAIAQHERRIATIDKERDLNAALVGELKTAAAGLNAAVETLPGTTQSAAGSTLKAFRRALPWPVAGKVVRNFRGTAQGSLPFNGVEIAAAESAAVTAVHDGEVAFSGPFPAYGHLIIVNHGGENFSLYGHLTSGSVTKGDRVAAGQVIGRAGRPPAARDTRLYFELRVDGQPVNPLQWLRQQ